jgi:hypothetical protein
MRSKGKVNLVFLQLMGAETSNCLGYGLNQGVFYSKIYFKIVHCLSQKGINFLLYI